jgi:hypothetical protein
MASIHAKLGTAAVLAIAAVFVSPGVVRAAGPFDGNWVINAHGAGGREGGPAGGNEAECSAFRLPVQIKDNQVIGTYRRSSSVPTEIVPSQTGSPAKGIVLSDGTFNVQWDSYNLTGKITGNTLVAYWTGQCGPRSATGSKVSP